jgi:deazaflavin-dependent oxidoreductase (nitroreductase family)
MAEPLQPEVEQKLRQGFRYLNRFMVFMWRLGLGRFMSRRELTGQIMVITHTGRKSGLRRRTPVNYALVDGEVYCTAGFGAQSDWYRNIQADPQVEVWLPDGWWAGVAEDVSAAPQRLELLRQVLVASGFASVAAGIDPFKISDAELARVSEKYCLVRIRRTLPCTGVDGPGDLAWVWPLVTLVLAVMLAVRKTRWTPHQGLKQGASSPNGL